MERERVIKVLQMHADELKAVGIDTLSVFGSVARDEQIADSDVDIVIRLNRNFSATGFSYFGALDSIEMRLSELVGRKVDLLVEPVHKQRLTQDIQSDRVVAF